MIKKILFVMFIMGMMTTYSCKDEDLAPIITFDQAGKGAYVRLVSLNTGEYDLNNLSGTAYDADVDFVDIDGGKTVTNYDVYVSYKDNSGSGLDKGEQLYKAWTSGDFGTSVNENVGTNLNIPLSEVASLLGLALDDSELIAGNFFNFRTEITSDGIVRNFVNSSSAVNGPAFQGHFNFSVKVTCPVDDANFSGDYMVEALTTDEVCFGGLTFESGVTWNVQTIPGSSTKRRLEGICYLPGLGCFSQTFEFDLVCTEITMDAVDTGLSCVAANIVVEGGAPQPFDFNDDSEFTLEWVDFAVDGDCGCDAVPIQLKLTKI